MLYWSLSRHSAQKLRGKARKHQRWLGIVSGTGEQGLAAGSNETLRRFLQLSSPPELSQQFIILRGRIYTTLKVSAAAIHGCLQRTGRSGFKMVPMKAAELKPKRWGFFFFHCF